MTRQAVEAGREIGQERHAGGIVVQAREGRRKMNEERNAHDFRHQRVSMPPPAPLARESPWSAVNTITPLS